MKAPISLDTAEKALPFISPYMEHKRVPFAVVSLAGDSDEGGNGVA